MYYIFGGRPHTPGTIAPTPTARSNKNVVGPSRPWINRS